MTADPFAHHPELRGLVKDPDASFPRSMTIAKLDAMMRERGLPGGWWLSDAEREACRHAALAGRRDGDLWVFAYGSLMWDPGLRFAELRRAHAPGHARRFILKDVYGGRGDRETPGLMAALDAGAGCDGLLFRIAQADVEAETEALWRRERIAPAYRPAFIEARLSDRTVEALTFVADHDAELIAPDISRAEQLRCLAHGCGFLGSSLDYLRNVCAHCRELGVPDAEAEALLAEAEAVAAQGADGGGGDAGGPHSVS